MKRKTRMHRISAKQSSPSGVLDRDIRATIGDQLRVLHDDIVKQGVPDRFVGLLSRLDRRDEREGG
jgi:hypothetical protein